MSPMEFIDGLTAVYRLSKEAEESELTKRQWAQAMLALLRPWKSRPDVLARAHQKILETHKDRYRMMPLPAVCIEACRDAEDMLNASKVVEEAKKTGQPLQVREDLLTDKYTAAKQRADKILNDNRDLARKAVKGGWIGMLHGFVEKHGRVPAGNEIGELIHGAKETKDMFENAVKDLSEPCDKTTRARRLAIVSMGEKVMKANAELETRFA